MAASAHSSLARVDCDASTAHRSSTVLAAMPAAAKEKSSWRCVLMLPSPITD